jgi:hypothetical protein
MAEKTQLHQHLASEPNVREKERILAKETIIAFDKKPHLFNGFFKTYQPKDVDGEQFPSESSTLVTTVQEKLKYYFDSLKDAINHSAVKEETNATAVADLLYENHVIAKNLHAPTLLNLENRLKELRKVLIEILTLDPKVEWKFDEDNQYHKTDPIETHKSKKSEKVITLAKATKEHPAQAQLAYEDKLVGYWKETKTSGAITPKMKSEILTRHDNWEIAVKEARQRANNAEIVEDPKIGDIILDNILHGGLPL